MKEQVRSFTGKVKAAKTPQTVAVVVGYVYKHPKYGKIIRRTTKVLAHNEFPEIKVGDMVRIVKSRPYSKKKHFKVTEVIN